MMRRRRARKSCVRRPITGKNPVLYLTKEEGEGKILLFEITAFWRESKLSYDLKEISKDIRCDILRCIGHLGVGHIGGCLSVVELLAVLYFEAMNIDPANPKMEGRDRFVCSKGHAGPAVYAALANRGYICFQINSFVF